jgi:serine protease Do
LTPADAGLRGLPVGALVTAVAKGGPGEAAGIKTGDVITAVDDVDVAVGHPLPAVLISRFRPAQRVTVSLTRSATQTQVQATLGSGRPSCG